MAQLHELLAVEGDLEKGYRETLNSAEKVFKDKAHLFTGYHKRLELFKDDDSIDTPEEHLEISATVIGKLDDAFDVFGKYFDALIQKEQTNQGAKADLVVDGKVIAKDLPATFLLGMETRLRTVKELIDKIPVLQSGIAWEKDKTKDNGVWKSVNDVKKYKTRKTYQPIILYEATKEHAAQVEKITVDENIGMYIETHWSGMFSEAEKRNYLNRLNKLIQAVKKARQRANQTEVVERIISKEIFNYIRG